MLFFIIFQFPAKLALMVSVHQKQRRRMSNHAEIRTMGKRNTENLLKTVPGIFFRHKRIAEINVKIRSVFQRVLQSDSVKSGIEIAFPVMRISLNSECKCFAGLSFCMKGMFLAGGKCSCAGLTPFYPIIIAAVCLKITDKNLKRSICLNADNICLICIISLLMP